MCEHDLTVDVAGRPDARNGGAHHFIGYNRAAVQLYANLFKTDSLGARTTSGRNEYEIAFDFLDLAVLFVLNHTCAGLTVHCGNFRAEDELYALLLGLV